MNEELQNQTSNPEVRQGLVETAAEFSRGVGDVARRLSTAAEDFLSITSNVVAQSRTSADDARTGATEARTAAEEARAASAEAHAAREAAEAVREQVTGTYMELTALVRDLQTRIAALATLARPLPEAPLLSNSSQPAEAAADEPAAPVVIAPAGWTPQSLQLANDYSAAS